MSIIRILILVIVVTAANEIATWLNKKTINK